MSTDQEAPQAPVATAALPFERLAVFHAARRHIFASRESLRWFIRTNKAELIKAGALSFPNGSWLVNPEIFDQVILAVGKRRAEGAPGV